VNDGQATLKLHIVFSGKGLQFLCIPETSDRFTELKENEEVAMFCSFLAHESSHY